MAGVARFTTQRALDRLAALHRESAPGVCRSRGDHSIIDPERRSAFRVGPSIVLAGPVWLAIRKTAVPGDAR